ncbi:MAG: hypothetical protein Q4D57_06395 [Clostridia bacterium]|nr:hypothetical protein [Clostridia bacterium]
MQLFKELQTDAEGMAKQARKIKHVLKNSTDVEDPAKIKAVAKELLQKPGSSFLARHLKMIVTISQVADSLGMSSVCDIMEEAKKKEEKAAQAAKTEKPEVPVSPQE